MSYLEDQLMDIQELIRSRNMLIDKYPTKFGLYAALSGLEAHEAELKEKIRKESENKAVSKQEAQDALNWIKGEISYMDKYLNDDFADWYNTILKLQRRTKEINEKCKIIFMYAKNKQLEIEKGWENEA